MIDKLNFSFCESHVLYLLVLEKNQVLIINNFTINLASETVTIF